jgi:hypothetical protein
MKVVLSTTFDDQYFFMAPITASAWAAYGIDALMYLPNPSNEAEKEKLHFLYKYMPKNSQAFGFDAPAHKRVTYAQVSRLFPIDAKAYATDVFITSDVDMVPLNEGYFKQFKKSLDINVVGWDLLDEVSNQIPMCYLAMPYKFWQRIYNPEKKSLQELLDHHVGTIECEDFRGNQWCLDQFLAKKLLLESKLPFTKIERAMKPHTHAKQRIDREDLHFATKMDNDQIDYHAHRPGHMLEAFNKISFVINRYHVHMWWLDEYFHKYNQLLIDQHRKFSSVAAI